MREKLLNLNGLVLLIVFLFALLFRVSNLNLVEFKIDEAVNLLLAARPVLHHSLPPGGTVSSIGILNPPFFNYLLSPLTIFTLDPKIFSLFIGILNSIAIVFFYLIVKKYYGNLIAFISSILFSLSPWAIIYSRKIWEQDLLIPSFVILLYSAHKIIKEKRGIFWLPLTFFSILAIQLHQVVILFIVLSLVFLLRQKVILNFKYILIGFLLGIIPLLPYLGYELEHGYPDIKAIFSSQSKFNQRSPELFLRPLEITGQGYINFEIGSDLGKLIQLPFIKQIRTIFYFEYILLLFGAFICVRKVKSLRFLSIPTIILPFLYFFLKIEPFMHYYIIVLPVLFLFLGVSFEFFITNNNKALKYSSIVLFLILIVSSLYFDYSLFNLLKKQGYLSGDYGSALASSEKSLKNNKYNEAFLYQFIPLGYYFGYNPFAKMIYGDISAKVIPSLERKLETGDNDSKNELLAYYTKEVPKLQTIDILKKKQSDIPQYSDIYKIVLEDYMARNYKKQYLSDSFNFTFFYPQHWHVEEKQDITVMGDYLTATIQKNKTVPNYKQEVKTELMALGEKGEKIKCKNNNVACGVYYSFKSFNAVVEVKGSNEKGIENEINAFDELLMSLRYISQ